MNNLPIKNLIFLIKKYEIEKQALYDKMTLLSNSFDCTIQTTNEIDIIISQICNLENKSEKVYQLLEQIEMQSNPQQQNDNTQQQEEEITNSDTSVDNEVDTGD